MCYIISVYDNSKKEELKLKKLISLLMSVALFGMSANAALFTDTRTHWASEYINALSEKGVINGVSETVFAPNSAVTRAEYLKMIMNSVGMKTVSARKGECLELKGSEWYAPYLQAVVDEGLLPKEMITDYSVEIVTKADGTTKAVYKGAFNGALPITRQEMAAITQNLYQYQQNARTMQTTKKPEPLRFGDSASISSWAVPAVELAVAQGFIVGMENGNFEPNSTATRAQAAAIIYRVLGKVESWNV